MIRFNSWMLCLIVGHFAFCLRGGTVQVFFGPKGGCTAAIVDALRHATNSVYVQAYSFTSAPIAEALVQASKRRVNVTVLLDKSQRSEKYSSADFLKNAGIKTLIDASHAIAHNKIMIIDTNIVITGSFNFTKAAEESNAENVLVIKEPQLARIYLDNWKIHLAHSLPYRGKSESQRPKTTETRKSANPRGASQPATTAP